MVDSLKNKKFYNMVPLYFDAGGNMFDGSYYKNNSSFPSSFNIKDTSSEKQEINEVQNTQFDTSSRESFLNQSLNTRMAKADYVANDFREKPAWQEILEIGGSAAGLIGGIATGNPLAAIGSGASFVNGLNGALSGIEGRNIIADDINKKAQRANTIMKNNEETAKEKFDLQDAANFLSNYVSAYGGKLYDDGGSLSTHGGDFSNDIRYINAGGTHEENKYEGVPMGIAEDGQPNLVEEGEVIYGDYVFSNRLAPTKEQLEEVFLKVPQKEKSFAELAKDLAKESEERPNDPISKAGLAASMMKLRAVQEATKEEINKKQMEQSIDKMTPEQQAQMVELSQAMQGSGFARGGRLFAGGDELNKEIDSLWNSHFWDWYGNSYEPDSGYGNGNDLPTWMRYAPIAGAGMAALANRKDYSDIDEFAKMTANPRTVTSQPIGDYIKPDRMSAWELQNPIERQAAATRSAILNSSAGNSASARAALIGSDYNTLGQLGAAYLQGKQYNDQQRKLAAEFNRGTNQYNSQAAQQAQSMNMYLNNYDLQRAAQIMAGKNAIDSAYNAAKSTNLSRLFDSLGGIGEENMYLNIGNNNPAYLYKILDKYFNMGLKNNGGGE